MPVRSETFGQGAAGARVDYANELGARRDVVEHGLGVTAAAATHGQVVELLGYATPATDGHVELLGDVLTFALGVGDVDADLVAGAPCFQRVDTDGVHAGAGTAGQDARRFVGLAFAANAHDVAAAAAVVEVAIDGVRQVRTRHEVTKAGAELRPVGDQGGLVEFTLIGEPDEGRDSGAHTFDGLAGAFHLFDVNTGG